MFSDLKYSFRTLRKAPVFTAVVVLTLGLGIGANAAIFSLLDQVLLRSLPVKDPGSLVVIDGPGPFVGRTMNEKTFSYPMYADFRDRNEGFAGILARMPLTLTVSWHGEAERAQGDLVSGNYFDVLGVRAHIGRVFTPADDRIPGAHPLAVLSYGYWMRRFGGDPAVLGQTVVVNGHPLTVIGVSAPRFAGLEAGGVSDVMVPVMMKAQMTPTWNDLDNRRSRWLNVIGRLKPGVPLAQAGAQLDTVYHQANEQELAQMSNGSPQFRERFLAKRLDLQPGGRGFSPLRQQFSTPLIVLMCMVGVVLLIACANVANLMLARTAARRKDVVVRLALGAGRGTIVRQRLVEAGVLAAGGALFGLVISVVTGRFLLSVLPGDAMTRTLSAAPDARVLLFTLGVAVVTALLFGGGPAFQATRASVSSTLREEGTSVAGGGRQARVRRALVIAQVALSMALLAGAGLFARSLYNLTAVNPGFEVDHLVTFAVDPTLNGYSNERSRTLMRELQSELGSIPGVKGVSMAELGPLTGNQWSMSVKVDGYHAREDEDLNPRLDGVAPGYFETMGIPLVQGRDFTERDAAGAPKVAIINETMAKYFFGDASPIGRRFGYASGHPTDTEIIGVVRDTRTEGLRDTPGRFFYIPYLQDEGLTQLTYYVRAAGDPADVAQAVRARVRRIDANLPIADLRTMEAQVADSVFVDRLVAMLSVAFGLLATLLAAVGLFGVMNYAVTRRTREIGIRMALGAERGRVLRMVLGEVAVLAGTGVAAGLALTFWVSRRIESQLFGLTAHDPLVLAGATLALVCVAFLAGLVPARRATSIDPLTALRTE